LAAQSRMIREIQGINAEFLDRCDEINMELLEVQALYNSKCKEIAAERATAANVESELQCKLDEISAQYASAKEELVEIQLENERLVGKLEQELNVRVEMEKRCDHLDKELRSTREEAQKQRIIAAAAHAETIAGGDHLMSLHAILAQRDREVTEYRDRLLQIVSRLATTEVPPTAKSPPVRPIARSKVPKAPKPLKK
jgi:chromosome segregation ATPase